MKNILLILALLFALATPAFALSPTLEVDCCYELVENITYQFTDGQCPALNLTNEQCEPILAGWARTQLYFSSGGDLWYFCQPDTFDNEFCKAYCLDNELELTEEECETFPEEARAQIEFQEEHSDGQANALTVKTMVGLFLVGILIWFLTRKKK